MNQTRYQITLSVNGDHSVSVSGDDPGSVKEGLAWAKGIYLKLRERSAAPAARSETVHHEITAPAPEDSPTCAIHNLPMVRVNGRKGQFWSCHEKLADQSWCPYKPPKA
jgi:hypothetical protein